MNTTLQFSYSKYIGGNLNTKITFNQRTLTYLERGNINVWLTSCLIGLDSTGQVKMLLIQHKQSS